MVAPQVLCRRNQRELQGFEAVVLPQTEDLITWRIGDDGFDMYLSGQVPGAIASHLPAVMNTLLHTCTRDDIEYWAIHPGGRTVLDAVKTGAKLEEQQLSVSREVLRKFGNMSSATIMFVLQAMLEKSKRAGQGLAMAFGPGLTVESMRFALQE